MTILDGLKKLYVKLGGTIDEKHSYDDICRLMEDVADVINNSPCIPEVTSEDDGKVLKVVDGAWNKADANGTIVINGFHDRNIVSLDIRQGEIFDLLKDGKEVVIKAINNENEYIYRKSANIFSDTYQFLCMYWASGKFNVEALSIIRNGNYNANYSKGTISFDS